MLDRLDGDIAHSVNRAFAKTGNRKRGKMRTIVISSQKGGGGKTTLTALLSVEAERAGDGPAWLIDTDRQGTLSQWHERREAEKPERAAVSFAELAANLLTIATAHGGAFCFIDTAPTISGQTEKIIALADLVLIPVQPSPLDAWAIGDTVNIARSAGKPFLFVMTKANAQANITAQTIAALSHHGPVARSFIASRVAYAAAMATGRTAPEVAPSGPAAHETSAIWQEVRAQFTEFAKTRKSKVAKLGKEGAHA
jgi:chromosome partitioning protein